MPARVPIAGDEGRGSSDLDVSPIAGSRACQMTILMRTASRSCPTLFLRDAGFRRRVSGVTLSWSALSLTERNPRDRECHEDEAALLRAKTSLVPT